MGLFGNSEAAGLVRKVEELKGSIDALGTIRGLKEQIASLEIQRDKKQEEYDRQERELRHMIGLEKKRQEFEVESAKRSVVLDVREENLTAERKRFEEQMKFHETRFTEEVGYLKEMVANVLERLPNINVER